MEQPQHPTEITHTELWGELRVMQKELDHIKKAIDRVTDAQSQEIKDLKEQINGKDGTGGLRQKYEDLRLRMGQVIIIAVLASMAVPIIINAMDPRLHFGSDSTELHR